MNGLMLLLQKWVPVKKVFGEPGMVAHAYNPSYLGS
jgi:hypothetical protein